MVEILEDKFCYTIWSKTCEYFIDFLYAYDVYHMS